VLMCATTLRSLVIVMLIAALMSASDLLYSPWIMLLR
jgi:hypothetical protein